MAAATFLPGNCGYRCLGRSGEGARNPRVLSIGWKPQPAAVGRSNGVQAGLVADHHTALVPVASRHKSVIPAESELLRLSDIRWSRSSDDLPPISLEKLDEWITDSITEIVKNIGEAPFLLHIFHGDGSADDSDGAASSSSSQPSLILKKEPAVPGSWPSIRRRWDEGEWSTPDGVILVEELKGEEPEDGGCGAEAWSRDQVSETCEKTWGILVQGRGAECSACYILNTCRVRSLAGTCTHFCLVRAQCFGDTAEKQLKKAFLVTDRQ